MADENKSFKINKTLSFTEKDRELVTKLEEMGYFEKAFNFNNYVKNLIVNDIYSKKEVFSETQKEEIVNIVMNLLKSNNIDTNNIQSQISSSLSDFEKSLNEVTLDSDDIDALEMDF